MNDIHELLSEHVLFDTSEQLDVTPVPADATLSTFTEQVAPLTTTMKDDVKHSDEPLSLKDIKSETQAMDYFIGEVKRRMRFDKYDNMIDNLTHKELEMAVEDAMDEINSTPPFSNYTPLSFVTGQRRYRRVAITCAAKWAVFTLISEWTANGMDVNIEDLSLSSKLSDFQSLFQTLNDEYKELLQQFKAYDKLYIRSATFSTGRRRGSATETVSRRISNIRMSGGRI